MQSLTQMHLESLSLTLDLQPSKEDEWKGVCSAQEDVKMIKNAKRDPQEPATNYL
jgi:hypothetical protein